ncbi:unnamed protein product [Pleuronectes platessa]|uniref:Uncharacterized protein n=1 Tax=Pleuronectes platessa TaxID=8262 RepID=A0A9N7Y8C3_PLEPL|nr:unnamed protein product [Pleuronectes platessa]
MAGLFVLSAGQNWTLYLKTNVSARSHVSDALLSRSSSCPNKSRRLTNNEAVGKKQEQRVLVLGLSGLGSPALAPVLHWGPAGLSRQGNGNPLSRAPRASSVLQRPHVAPRGNRMARPEQEAEARSGTRDGIRR